VDRENKNWPSPGRSGLFVMNTTTNTTTTTTTTSSTTTSSTSRLAALGAVSCVLNSKSDLYAGTPMVAKLFVGPSALEEAEAFRAEFQDMEEAGYTVVLNAGSYKELRRYHPFHEVAWAA
jgi:hypothetical protein